MAEAFAIAAERWPVTGVPPNPGGWITTTARNRAVDRLRREATRGDRHRAAHRLREPDVDPPDDPDLAELDAFVDVVPDDQLRLMFLCCHPALLAAVSLVFTEGHTATSGEGLVRSDLSDEAIRLGRVLVELMPDEPEAVGLLALMLLTDARRPARLAPDGMMVRLADQDRSRWDGGRIAEGHALVRSCLRRNRPGPFQVQAAIAAVHAEAPTAQATDWRQVIALDDQLHALRPDPVVALHRAIALAELHGAATGLDALEAVAVEPLQGYQPYHAARADLLARAGRGEEARAAYDRALALTTNRVERDFLSARRAAA